MSEIIGIDPHKATHTAVAIDRGEQPIATQQVVADRCQTQRLLACAASFGFERTWAIESANGLGKPLAQQLLGAGEHVVDVPPTLSARVRLLGSTKAGKNDSNDALSTAIAGLRHCELRTVRVEDHTAVIRLLIDRYDALVSLRTQATRRLHAVLRELIAAGAPRRLSANRAAKLLRSVHPAGLVAVERQRLAVDLLADVRRLDQDIAATRSRITDAVEDSKTTLLELHGIGPIVAADILGHVANPARFATPQRFASNNPTAPIEASPRLGRTIHRGHDRDRAMGATDVGTNQKLKRSPTARPSAGDDQPGPCHGATRCSHRSGECRQPAGVELVVAVGPARQDTEAKGSIGVTGQHLGQRRSHLIVANHEVIPWVRVEGKPGVAKVPGDDPGLVLLVIIDPQLDHRLGCFHDDHATAPSRLRLVARIRLGRPEAVTQELKRRWRGIRQNHRVVERVRKGRHHLEAGRAEGAAPRDSDDRTDADGAHRPAERNEVIARHPENRDAEELVSLPAVTDLVRQVGVAQRPGAAPDHH